MRKLRLNLVRGLVPLLLLVLLSPAAAFSAFEGPVFAGASSTGGGGALALGPETNQFTGANQAAAETARNTYAGSHASWLATYAANPNIYIELSWGTNVAFQRRVGSSWQTVQGLIRGEPGTPGAPGSPSTAGQVRTLLGFTEQQLNDLFVGSAVTGAGATRAIVLTQKDGGTITLPVPDTTGGGDGGESTPADGVVTGATFNQAGTQLTLTRSVGANIVVPVPAALRASGGTTLPSYLQSSTRTLQSRAGSLFWSALNTVPNTPGTQSGIERVLTVTGTGDTNYAWRDPPKGVTVQDSGTQEGTGIETVNFGPNLDVAVNGTTATVTGRAGGDGGGEAVIADNSIAPIKAQAGTAAQQKAWRNRLASSRIGQVSAALPEVTDYNIGDLLIVGRGGATTNMFVDLDAPATQLTTTVAGDLVMVLSNRWTRVGNLFSGGIAAAAAQTTANANAARVNKLNVFGTIEINPPGIPDKTFPEFLALKLSNKLVSETIIDARVRIDGQTAGSAGTLELAAMNGLASYEPTSGAPGNRVQVGGLPGSGDEGIIMNLVLNAAARANLSNITTAAQSVIVTIDYKFAGTGLALDVPADAQDRVSFGVNNNSYPAPAGGLTQSQVDARVQALRALVGTSAAPTSVDRFFFTDEGESGDPLRYTLGASLINRTLTARTPTAGATRTWTYTLDANDTEIWIGGTSRSSLSSTLIPRAILSSTAMNINLDHRNPAASGTSNPDGQSAGATVSLSGNTLTVATANWGNIGTPLVYSK